MSLTGRYLTDSPTAWRARIRVVDSAGEHVAVPEDLVQQSYSGIRSVFERAFASVVQSIHADHAIVDLDVEAEYTVLGPGNLGIWFDARRRQGLFSSWFQGRQALNASVDALIGSASQELVALVRALVMRAEHPAEDFLVRPIPGPQGPRTRVEASVPGAAPARMGEDLWQWSNADHGRRACRDLLAVLDAPGCAAVEVIFYEGQESEHTMTVPNSRLLREVAEGGEDAPA